VIVTERSFLPILALAGATIVAHQGLDLFSVAAGTDLQSPTGRLSVAAILWAHGPALLAGNVLLVLAAVLSSWTRVLVALALGHLLLAAAALAGAFLFLADAGRVADSVAMAELTSFRLTVVRILVGLVGLGAGALVSGVSMMQVGRGVIVKA
jgi:hypothetical protein